MALCGDGHDGRVLSIQIFKCLIRRIGEGEERGDTKKRVKGKGDTIEDTKNDTKKRNNPKEKKRRRKKKIIRTKEGGRRRGKE